MSDSESVALLSIGQTATRLGVGVETVRRWTKKGHLRTFRTAGGHRRYRPEDVDSFLADAELRDAALAADDGPEAA